MLALFERIRDWWSTWRTRDITPERARARVRRGAEYLDRMDPDWYRRVNSESLELGDGHHCVLGQLHGEFRLGLGRSGLISVSSAPRPSLSPVAYGFKCVEGVPDEWQEYDYKLLNQAWRGAVRQRKKESMSGDSLPNVSTEIVASDALPSNRSCQGRGS